MNLFDKNNDYTAAATELDRKSYDAIKDIFDDFAKRGFSPREISYTIQNAVHDRELEILIFANKPKKKEEKRYAAKGPSWIEELAVLD